MKKNMIIIKKAISASLRAEYYSDITNYKLKF